MSDIKKILIAEDDPFLSKIMGNRLREEGFEVETAINGQDAIDKLSVSGFSIVMLDLIMPIKTGFDVLNELKEKDINTSVLVFTNLAQDEDKQEVMNLGAKGYYVKSDIAMDEMVETIKTFIN